MFLVLNIRNILDNFYHYGLRFRSTPTEFIPFHTIIATGALSIFVVMAFILEKMKFNEFLSPFSAVKHVLILENTHNFQLDHGLTHQPAVLSLLHSHSHSLNSLHSFGHNFSPQINFVPASQLLTFQDHQKITIEQEERPG